MKLHPPEVDIPEEDPFKNALFNRKEFAQSLTALLRNVEESMVIFVNAPWGEGKTTFAKMWQTHLKNDEKLIDVIRFDAYAADYFDDPFVSFTGEILELVKRRLDEAKGIETKTREFREAAVGVLKQLGSLGVKVGLRSITMGAVDLSNLSALKSVGDDLAEGISEIGERLLEKKIEGYAKEKEALAQFKMKLGELAKLVRDEQGFPLTIIVDELDRCRPDFALQLLERIKHLFDVDGVAFVLLVNREQIERYVRTVYGEKSDAPAYLLKFGTLFIDLPGERPGTLLREDRKEFCRRLSAHFGIDAAARSKSSFLESATALGNHFNLTLRETEKLFASLSLFYASFPKEDFLYDFLAVLLTILKLRDSVLYARIGLNSIEVQELMEQTGIASRTTRSGGGFDWDYLKAQIRHLLLSDASLKAAQMGPKPDTILSGIAARQSFDQSERKQILINICSHLDLFAFTSEAS